MHSVEQDDLHSGRWSIHPFVNMLTFGKGRPAALVVTLVLVLGYLWGGEWGWRSVREAVFDVYQQIYPRQLTELPVIIVDIDDNSVEELGQWPWSRLRLGRLIEAAYQLGALAIGLDTIMSEDDRHSPLSLVEDRPDLSPDLQEELKKLPSNDAMLTHTLQHIPVVLGRAGVQDAQRYAVPTEAQTPVVTYGDLPRGVIHSYPAHITNLPILENAAIGRGYLNVIPDRNGTIRKTPVVMTIAERFAPSLALELLRVATRQKHYTVYSTAKGVDAVQIGTDRLPTDADGTIRLYFSAADPRRRISALALWHNQAPAEMIQGHIVLIGATGVGVNDVVTTPVSPRIDGVEVQAQIIENLLSGSRLVRLQSAPWWEIVLMLAGALVLGLVLPRSQPLKGIGVFLVLAVLAGVVSFGAFIVYRILLDPSFAIMSYGILGLVFLVTELARIDRRRSELRLALEVARIEQLRIAGELRAAHNIQMGILPDPEAVTGVPEHVQWHAMLEPAEDVGGDLYDAFMLDEQHFFFLIGDVSGKGVPASLFMALSKTLCKSMALREQVPLDILMSLVNTEISRVNPESLFVTAVIGILDVGSGELTLCNAGHEESLLLRLRHGEVPQPLAAASGPPLCVLTDFSYTTEVVQMQPGDMLVLLTDGVTEAQNPAQELYGRQRALEYMHTLLVSPPASLTVKSLCKNLYDEVKRFTGSAAPSDDITIMAIHFRPPGTYSSTRVM